MSSSCPSRTGERERHFVAHRASRIEPILLTVVWPSEDACVSTSAAWGGSAMEFLILLGMCVLIIVGVAWLGRRRGDVDDPTLAARASSDVEADRMRSIRPARFRDSSRGD